MEDNENVLVIPEKRNLPFDRPIHAEILEPGTLPGSITGDIREVPAVSGKRLSSFLVRYNPVGKTREDDFVKFEVEVTFDRPVHAIACQRQALAQTDRDFATGTWNSEFRGIELWQIANPPDSVTLSADRRTVKVVFYAGISTDEIRVIVEDPS